MPLFDFSDDSSNPVIASGTGALTLTHIADGLKFTVSSPAASNYSGIWMDNGSSTSRFMLMNLSADSLTLNLQSTAQPSLTQFRGSASSPVSVNVQSVLNNWSIQFLNGTSVVASHASVAFGATITATGQFTAIKFIQSGGGHGYLKLSAMKIASMNCFCAGTLIDTPTGKRPVEDLTAGDKVLTTDGKETTVHWLGTQFVDTKLRHPKMVNPIRITAGALGHGLPERDLHLSQDHAVAIDGTLYNAGALVNGETIYQVAEMPNDGFTYYHVETDAHELLVAEGVAAESYIDYAGRDGFDNTEAGTGREIAEMDLPRVSTSRMVPEYLKPRKVA